MKYTCVLILLLSLSILSVTADEKKKLISQLSELIVLHDTTSFRYQETRNLELMDAPWLGGGLLLASKDGTLVKLQMQPHRKIMAITPGEMIYFDSENTERHRLPLSTPHPMTRHALIFQELIQGQLDKISTEYVIAFNDTSPSWSIELKPQSDHHESIFNSILMQGNHNNTTRSIVLKERGGDSSTLTMQELETGPQLEFMIERLLREAIGQ